VYLLSSLIHNQLQKINFIGKHFLFILWLIVQIKKKFNLEKKIG
jgi:hypothetical protein